MTSDTLISDKPERAAEAHPLALKIAQAAEKLTPLKQCTPDEARALRAERGNPFAPEPHAGVTTENITICIGDGDGAITLPARLYRPKTTNQEPQPALIYFHGGGFVLGDVAQYDTVTQQLAGLSGCTVISVEYRLAPEVKSATIYADAFAVWQWLIANDLALGLDKQRIAVGGDSAGANLAISVTLNCKQQQCVQPAFQLLIYPVTDYTMSMASIDEFANGYFLTRDNMEWFRAHFLEHAERSLDPFVSPLRANVAGLPPAVMITAGFDPLRDEGFAYAQLLKSNGVPIEHRCYTDMIHGFISFAGGVPTGMTALTHLAQDLSDAL